MLNKINLYMQVLFDRTISLKHNTLANIFLGIFLIDRFMMGSGEFLQIGTFKIRMLFNLLAFAFIFILLLKTLKVNRQAFFILVFYGISFCLSIVIALTNNRALEDLDHDIRPGIFFFLLLYFTYVIDTEKQVEKVGKIIKNTSLVIASLYIIILILIKFLNLPNYFIYLNIFPEGELMGRGGGFFFLSCFVYICVGFFFYFAENGFKNKMLAFYLLTAVALTLTRGFLLVMVIIVLYYVFLIKKRNSLEKITVLVLILILVPTILYLFSFILGDKSESDYDRVLIVTEVLEELTPFSLLVGHGFGHGIPCRPEHMEVTLMEILHKQGLFGMVPWFLLMFFIYANFKKTIQAGKMKQGLPFFLSSVFMFLVSQTNPFMTGPIGMTLLFVSMSALRVLGKQECDCSTQEKLVKNGELNPVGAT